MEMIGNGGGYGEDGERGEWRLVEISDGHRRVTDDWWSFVKTVEGRGGEFTGGHVEDSQGGRGREGAGVEVTAAP